MLYIACSFLRCETETKFIVFFNLDPNDHHDVFKQSLFSVGNPEGEGGSVAIGTDFVAPGCTSDQGGLLKFSTCNKESQFCCCASSQSPPKSLSSGTWRDSAASVL